MKYNIVKQDGDIFLTFRERVYLIDDNQETMLKNKNYNFDIKISNYHYYNYNNQNITILEELNNFRNKDVIIKFKNNKFYDIRQSNVIVQHYKHDEINTDYEIINYYPGHIIKQGIDSGKMKNPIWEVKTHNNEIFLLMFCEKDTFVKICNKSLKIIKDFETKNNIKCTFHSSGNGYVGTHFGSKYIYMHQIIMGLYGQGKETMGYSVDHINRDITDNTYINLRIAERKEQETNKKIRQKTKLPEGFISENLPMYVEYHTEKLPSGNIRDCFRISKIPNSKKKFVTSKSMNLSIFEKYRQVIEKYKEIYGEDMLKDIIYPKNI
jgi:hypothetical protein